MKEVLKYELTPMPLSTFKTNGSPRFWKAKSDLMNGLKVTVPTRGKTPDMTTLTDVLFFGRYNGHQQMELYRTL